MDQLTVFTVVRKDNYESVISGKTNRVMLVLSPDKDDMSVKETLLESYFIKRGDKYYTCNDEEIDPSWNAYILKEVYRLSTIAYWERNDPLGRIIPEDILPGPDEAPPPPTLLFRHHAVLDVNELLKYGKTGCVDSEGVYIPFGLSNEQLKDIHKTSLREWLEWFN